MANIYRVIHIKLNQLVQENVHTITDFTNEAYLSTITVANIFQSFTYKMAAKINGHRYRTKLHHCHPMLSFNTQCNFTKVSTHVVNEYYHIDVTYLISGIYTNFHRLGTVQKV